ncbi:hypothetical protein BX666DRAFT_972698 [Dichotomocladium elegans]|nr:hypothetical protein BX666DRAFT_972698 [Dichotomocladium elegans]
MYPCNIKKLAMAFSSLFGYTTPLEKNISSVSIIGNIMLNASLPPLPMAGVIFIARKSVWATVVMSKQ